MFENAIQACSDLAQHIATHDFDFSGSASKEAIRVLGREEVINEETTNTLVSRCRVQKRLSPRVWQG